jgi:hypothetical protein
MGGRLQRGETRRDGAHDAVDQRRGIAVNVGGGIALAQFVKLKPNRGANFA